MLFFSHKWINRTKRLTLNTTDYQNSKQYKGFYNELYKPNEEFIEIYRNFPKRANRCCFLS